MNKATSTIVAVETGAASIYCIAIKNLCYQLYLIYKVHGWDGYLYLVELFQGETGGP